MNGSSIGSNTASPGIAGRLTRGLTGKRRAPTAAEHRMDGPIGDCAVVVGGSVTGTLVARVLSEFYRQVIVIERDEVLGVSGPRRGVPHSMHAHGLHAGGYLILAELFPNLLEEARGLVGLTVRDFGRMRWYFDARPIEPADTGLLSIAGSRPVLENYLRSRVADLPNVTYQQSTEMLGLLSTPDHERVTGVRLRKREENAPEYQLEADLVVDTTGRGSRLPALLSELGYQRPEEEQIKIGLAYATRSFRRRPGTFEGPHAINPVASPAHPRGAFFGQAASGDCRLSLTGMLGDHPPKDLESFLEYTKTLPVADIYESVRDAEPTSDAAFFTIPSSVRRHYERLTRFPDRLLVMGDAVCSFNPVYGQGMTVAAMQVRALREHLRRHSAPDSLVFLKELARVNEGPWRISTRGDLEFPAVVGPRPLSVRLHNVVMTRLQYASTKDPVATRALMRVTGLVDPLRAIWRPRLLARVLWVSRDLRKAAPAPSSLSAASGATRVA
jgi:2-polyprenyl-6-methoxyphenol hydroxylase-like FAD-dependent oxidoreductase